MTIEDVEKRIEEIKTKVAEHDDEGAHSSEDALHEEVLRAIAAGATNAQDLAAMALTTLQLDFCRWCA